MIPRLKILRTKSRNGIDIPLNSRRTVDGQTVEVWGQVKKQVKNRVVVQWWIVHPVSIKQKHRPSGWCFLYGKLVEWLKTSVLKTEGQ